jgi:hypothetical protein
MDYLVATDAITKAVAMAGLWIVTLTPRFQVTEPQLWDLLVASPPYIFLFTALILLRRREVVWRSEMESAIEARDKRYDLMVTEHMKALELMDKERAREREQSAANFAAAIALYEARLDERGKLLRENTALLQRMVTLLDGQQKTPVS